MQNIKYLLILSVEYKYTLFIFRGGGANNHEKNPADNFYFFYIFGIIY